MKVYEFQNSVVISFGSFKYTIMPSANKESLTFYVIVKISSTILINNSRVVTLVSFQFLEEMVSHLV